MTSTVIASFAMAPVELIPVVQSLAQFFSIVWKERMINPLEEKLKVVEANRFKIHDMIIKVGRMKDMVQNLAMSLVSKRNDNAQHQEKLLEELKKALVLALAQLELVALEPEKGNLI